MCHLVPLIKMANFEYALLVCVSNKSNTFTHVSFSLCQGLYRELLYTQKSNELFLQGAAGTYYAMT